MMMRSILIFGVLAATLSSSFADCTAEAISGEWRRRTENPEAVDSATAWTWTLSEGNLVSKTQLEDSWTANSGPYFESETRYETERNSSCLFVLRAKKSVARSFRQFDEPVADVSEMDQELPPVVVYEIMTDASGRTLSARNLTTGKTVRFSKKSEK